MLRSLGVACLCVLLSGCAPLRVAWTGGSGRRCGGPLVSTHELGADFAIRDRVRVEVDGAAHSLLAVLEKRGDVLTLVVLRDLGPKTAVVRQVGTRVDPELFLGGSGLHPLALLRELHRVHFLALGDSPLPSGEHEGRAGGARLWEVWEDGQLRVRRWAEPEVELTWTAADRIDVRNSGCGYEATVRVLLDSRPEA